MFDILSVSYPDIQQMRRVVHALDVLQHSLLLDEDTLAEIRQQRAELIDHIEEWEGLSF